MVQSFFTIKYQGKHEILLKHREAFSGEDIPNFKNAFVVAAFFEQLGDHRVDL